MKKVFIILQVLFIAVLTVSAQPKIVFDKNQHDFGKVGEGDGVASYDFSFKNTGTSPLIIQDVKTTCGCTTPEWTKQPIRPGATGFIKVNYEVKGRPGAIDKSITVYSNGSSTPISLRIIGEVIPVDRRPEAFRYTAGSIRLDDMHVAFNRVYSYETSSLVVTAYNPGPNPVKISFVDLPAYIKVDVSPSKISKDEKASIKVTYDVSKRKDWGFVSDRISMILNDDKSKDYKLTVTADIEEDFSRWTASQIQNAAVVSLDKSTIDAGKIKKGEKKTYVVKVTNSGKSALQIRKVTSNSTQITTNAPKEIAPNATSEISITYDTSEQSGEQNKTVTLITNDPKNATVTIRLQAEVVD